MSDATMPPMDERARLELVRWLVDSYDQRKASLASRLSILLSADSLLLAATAFLVDMLWSDGTAAGVGDKVLQIVGSALIFTSLGLLLWSIFRATSGVANIWRTHQQASGTNQISRLVFYPRQTFAEFGVGKMGFDRFVDAFQQKTTAPGGAPLDIEREALGHLWVIIDEYRVRYGTLREATRFFVYSIIPIVASLAVILAKSV
jgi:hypothetical protein